MDWRCMIGLHKWIHCSYTKKALMPVAGPGSLKAKTFAIHREEWKECSRCGKKVK